VSSTGSTRYSGHPGHPGQPGRDSGRDRQAVFGSSKPSGRDGRDISQIRLNAGREGRATLSVQARIEALEIELDSAYQSVDATPDPEVAANWRRQVERIESELAALPNTEGEAA
jgi:hypothetical protein